jgi:hypothetical protein
MVLPKPPHQRTHAAHTARIRQGKPSLQVGWTRGKTQHKQVKATLTGTTPTNGHAARRLRTGCTEADAGSKTRSGTGRLRTRCWRVPDAGGTSILCVSMVNCSLSRKAGCRSRKAMRSVTGVDCEPNWAPERFAPGEKGLFECFSAVTWQPRLVSLEFRNRSSDRAVWICANNAHSEITTHGHP